MIKAIVIRNGYYEFSVEFETFREFYSYRRGVNDCNSLCSDMDNVSVVTKDDVQDYLPLDEIKREKLLIMVGKHLG